MDKLNEIKLFIYEHKKKIILISCLLFLFMISTTIFLTKNKENENKLVYDDFLNEKEIKKEETEKNSALEEKVYYFVDVKGYVNNPGVYSLLKGKRVVDAINQAGGLKKDANTSLLNLSMELHDGMVIVVYSNSEINNYEKVKEGEKIKEEICKDKIKNDACICNDNKANNSKEELVENQMKGEDSTDKNTSSEKININTASLEELMTLSKIGESKALAIIEYRTKIGLFKTIEEIKKVSGIGDVLFESLKAYITV